MVYWFALKILRPAILVQIFVEPYYNLYFTYAIMLVSTVIPSFQN